MMVYHRNKIKSRIFFFEIWIKQPMNYIKQHYTLLKMRIRKENHFLFIESQKYNLVYIKIKQSFCLLRTTMFYQICLEIIIFFMH